MEKREINNQFLRLPDVLTKVGISRAQVYKLIKQGKFPWQHRICQKISVWLSSEVDLWMNQQIQLSEKTP